MVYVLDTSSILSDPDTLEQLSLYHVVVPNATLLELEAKKNDKDVGFQARSALRFIGNCLDSGDILSGVDTGSGGTLTVDRDCFPDYATHDDQIIACAQRIPGSILVTEDLSMRIKAESSGCETFTFEGIIDSAVDMGAPHKFEVDFNYINSLYSNGMVYIEELEDLPINTSVILKSGTQSALGRINSDKQVEALVTQSFPISGRNSGQLFAIDALCSSEADVVSLGGYAGSGKTLLALAYAYSQICDKTSGINKIIVFRPVEAVGGQELGFLPGTEEEKMAPWAAAIDDALLVIMDRTGIHNLKSRRQLEVLPLTHIRGRSFRNTIVIVDEAQNLDLTTIVTAITRLGENSKIILTHDLSQRDNNGVGRYDGIYKVVKKLIGSELFIHIKLNKSERSKIADLVAKTFHL